MVDGTGLLIRSNALMAVGKTPDVWAAGVEEYGIINWFTMLQHEDALLQEYEKSLLGDPQKDRNIAG